MKKIYKQKKPNSFQFGLLYNNLHIYEPIFHEFREKYNIDRFSTITSMCCRTVDIFYNYEINPIESLF